MGLSIACSSFCPFCQFFTITRHEETVCTAERIRDYSFDQSVMLLSRIRAMGGRVNMSKFLLTVCACGLLLSSAFAEEKSPEQHREDQIVEGLPKMNWARVVASGTNQRIGFFYAVNPDCSANGDINIRITKQPQSRPRLQPTSPTSKEKISATDAISKRFEASKSITSQPINTPAAIHSSYSFSSPAASARKFIST